MSKQIDKPVGHTKPQHFESRSKQRLTRAHVISMVYGLPITALSVATLIGLLIYHSIGQAQLVSIIHLHSLPVAFVIAISYSIPRGLFNNDNRWFGSTGSTKIRRTRTIVLGYSLLIFCCMALSVYAASVVFIVSDDATAITTFVLADTAIAIALTAILTTLGITGCHTPQGIVASIHTDVDRHLRTLEITVVIVLAMIIGVIPLSPDGSGEFFVALTLIIGIVVLCILGYVKIDVAYLVVMGNAVKRRAIPTIALAATESGRVFCSIINCISLLYIAQSFVVLPVGTLLLRLLP